MTTLSEINLIPICMVCKHHKAKFKCPAFPNGIPDEILNGNNDHSKPLPEQDNDIVFEPIDKND